MRKMQNKLCVICGGGILDALPFLTLRAGGVKPFLYAQHVL